MSFFLEKECEVNFGFDEEELARRVVDYCLEYMSFPFEAEVNLTLTDNEGIRTINREFRQKRCFLFSFFNPFIFFRIP